MARLTPKQRKAKAARDLLENETLVEIFESRKQEIFEQWQASATPEERESCYFEIIALEGLRDGIYARATDTDTTTSG